MAPTSKKPAPVASRSARSWLAGRQLYALIFLIAIVLTVGMYLDQRFYSQQRPLIWEDFNPGKIEAAVRSGRVATLLVGPFDSLGRKRELAARLDQPDVRREAHRLPTLFSAVDRDSVGKAELETWLEEMKPRGSEALGPFPAGPFLIVYYRKLAPPRIVKLDRDPQSEMSSLLKEIRLGRSE